VGFATAAIQAVVQSYATPPPPPSHPDPRSEQVRTGHASFARGHFLHGAQVLDGGRVSMIGSPVSLYLPADILALQRRAL
jgi:hypothetical protein